MCRATNDIGGPRRCSGDTRAAYVHAATAVAALDQAESALCADIATAGLQIRDQEHTHAGAWISPARGVARCRECGYQFEVTDRSQILEPEANADSQWLVGTARHRWTLIGEGQYGQVYRSPDGSRAVKELIRGMNFGRHEVELAIAMGELGHSPKVFHATEDFIEMEAVPGAPLWSHYRRGEDEPTMTTAQAGKVAAAIYDLHRLGFAHNDLHALQLIVSGDEVKMVDFGLSVRHEDHPVRALQDLNKIHHLVRWDSPELQSIPFVRLVNKYLPEYRSVAGRSQAAIARREELAKGYLKELEEL